MIFFHIFVFRKLVARMVVFIVKILYGKPFFLNWKLYDCGGDLFFVLNSWKHVCLSPISLGGGWVLFEEEAITVWYSILSISYLR